MRSATSITVHLGSNFGGGDIEEYLPTVKVFGGECSFVSIEFADVSVFVNDLDDAAKMADALVAAVIEARRTT
tara:strand:+ start:146 stop:364 length:219 start_codon:yes stop_codon:yes gene_type:complete